MASTSTSSPHLKRKRDREHPISTSLGALTNTEAISFYLQLLYDEEVQLDQNISKCYDNPSSSSLEKLQQASQVSSDFHDCMPFAADGMVWTYFQPGVADAIVGLSTSPGTFNVSPLVAAGVCAIRSKEEMEEELAESPKCRRYYTRRLLLRPKQYAKALEVYARRYPEDIAHTVLHLQYLGFGERASALLSGVMTALGHPDVRLKMDPTVEGIRLSLVPMYSGTTIHSPERRNIVDTQGGSNTSRIRNFAELNKDVEWEILEWIPLQLEIEDLIEWRTVPEQGQIEAVLTDCVIPNFNKARGGWIHAIKLHPSISTPMDSMLQMLPPAIPSDPVPAALTDDLHTMVDLEQAFVKAFSTSNDVGTLFGEVAVEHVKREFVSATRWINGSVTSVTLTKDLPQEAGHGHINTSLAGDQVGRGVALYQAIMKAIYSREATSLPSYQSIRDFDGSFIDLWRSFELHKWWGLLILLTGLYFRRMQPYAIFSWSSISESVFKSNLLVTLPRDLGLDDLQGPEAVATLTPQLVEHPSLRQTFHARKDPNFRQDQGQARIVRFGAGELDLAIHMGKGDPGDPFYRPVLFHHEKRRHSLVNCLSLALGHLTEHHLASQEPPTTQKERVKLLRAIKKDFDKIALESGMRQALNAELRRQTICDQAQGALLGKNVEVEEVGAEDADEEDTGRREKRRKTEGAQHPRNNGLLALGEPFSTERRRQLAGLQDNVRVSQMIDQDPLVVWHDGAIATSAIFEHDFLRLPQNHSLQQSINAHGRTLEGIEARRVDGRRLAALNKQWATATREGKAALWGGWIKAEQYEEITTLLPSLRFDLTHQLFESSQRTTTCASCNEVVVGQDRNTEHRCTIDAKPVKIVQEAFPSYNRILYPGDLLSVQAIDSEVRSVAASKCHLEEAPATDWLVMEEDGERIYNLPFSPLKTVREVTGVVFWDTNEPKDSDVNFLMAADVALREWCPGYDSLDMAERGGKTIAEGARTLANSSQQKVWRQNYMDRLVEAVHAPCTRGGGKKEESMFYWFRPRRLVDLPYSIARAFLYRAVRGGGDGKEAPTRTKGKEKKVSGKTFKEWQTLLEWLE